jgi:hypothetical protein
MTFPSLAAALFTRGTDEEDPHSRLTELIEAHAADFETYQRRTNGRSLFFKPPPKRVVAAAPPPPPPAPDAGEVVAQAPKPPVAPANYQGPTPIMLMGNAAYFQPIRVDAGVLKVPLGEEVEGVKVLEINAPWSVKVGYQGGEYDVPLFARVNDAFFATGPAKVASLPGLISMPSGGAAAAAAAAGGETRGEPGDGDEVPPPDDEGGARAEGGSPEDSASDSRAVADGGAAGKEPAPGGAAEVPGAAEPALDEDGARRLSEARKIVEDLKRKRVKGPGGAPPPPVPVAEEDPDT